jgi:hypothetical protein
MASTYCSSDIRICIERLPQVIDRSRARLRAHIEEDTHVWIQAFCESVEEPSMRIDLLLIPFFQCEDDLNGHDTAFCTLVLQVRRESDLRGVFVDLAAVLAYAKTSL